MKRLGRLFLLAIIALCAPAAAQAPAAKLALVVGNADYDGDGRVDVTAAGVANSTASGFVPDLRNPMNDAADMRDALTRIGFKVDYVVNADAAAMTAALAQFRTKIAAAPGDAQVVIFYAGHAIQVDGANYLIPARAKLPAMDFANISPAQARAALGTAFIGTDKALDIFREPRAPGLNILVLDSCRTNPWAQQVAALGRGANATGPAPRGMARLEATIPRTIVFFSTAPGSVAADGEARNSPFAGALKTRITESGPVGQMIDDVGSDVQRATRGQQTPWFQSASVGPVCLARCMPPIGAITVLGADVRVSQLGAEAVALESAIRSWSAVGWRGFLRDFPNGRHSAFAREALSSIENPLSEPSATDQLAIAGRSLDSISDLEWRTADPDVLAALAVTRVGKQKILELAKADARAQWVAGWAMATGQFGFDRDPIESMVNFVSSASQGNGRGQSTLALANLLGRGGIRKNEAEAVRLYQLAANQGYSEAQARLGIMYAEGSSGFARNEPEALRLFRLAAAQGESNAQLNLGVMYLNGAGGLPKNDSEAVRLFRLSAAQGNSSAQAKLAAAYFNGRGVPAKDEAEAARLARLSAMEGDPFGLMIYALMLESGAAGVPRNLDEAIRLYKASARQGFDQAQQRLRELGETW